MPARIKSAPGQCPKCDKSYADLLEHITKKHRHDRFTEEEMGRTSLAVCICGRVVLNTDGLKKHQQRFACLGTQERDTTPAHRSSLGQLQAAAQSSTLSSLTTLPSSSRPSSSLTSLPASSSHRAPSIPVSHPPSEVSSRLTSLPSLPSTSRSVSVLAQVLDISADIYDDPVYNPSPLSSSSRSPSRSEDTRIPEEVDGPEEEEVEETVEDMEEVSYRDTNADGQRHELASSRSGSVWIPSRQSSSGPNTPSIQVPSRDSLPPLPNHDMDMTDVRDMEDDSEEVEEDNEDIQPGPPAMSDLPFMDEFSVLDDLSNNSAPVLGLNPMPVDVDRWEMVISPAEYLLRFKDTLATVQLVNRAPHRKMHTTYHRGPAFDQWLLLAEANHQLWVDPRYKDRFFEQLEEYQTAQPGTLKYQASLGSVHLSTSVFVHCLIKSDCDTIRLKAYGQKTPLLKQFLNKEPAQVDHRWAEHNEWDIGQSFSSPYIWLFASATGRRHGLKHYPMLLPGSGNYGTVHINTTHKSRHFSLKVYPRIVHVIKSFNSRLQGSVPKTLQGVRNQVAACLRMIHSLTSKGDMALGGFRIEVTVKAQSLRAAHKLVTATGFLDPSYWLGIGEGPHADLQLTANLVTRKGLLANANWVYQQAVQADLFHGRGSDTPTKAQIQALTDILNGLGWNSGLRKPTKALDPDAWWRSTPSTDRSNVFRQLSERYSTDEEIQELFETARDSGYPYALPCMSHPGDPNHRYQIHNRSPFRVRCSHRDCQHKLQRTALVHWIAELIQGGVVDASRLNV